jgi:hypothetical protein
VATATTVGILLFYGMHRDTVTPTYILVPNPQPEMKPRDAQRSDVAPTPPTPPAEVVDPLPAVSEATNPSSRATAGTLTVLSQPSAATVYVNDEQIGRTPLTLASISPGAYRVRVELEGHPAWSSSIQIEAGSSEKMIAFIEKRGPQ